MLRDVQGTVARLRMRENAICAGILRWGPWWTNACLVYERVEGTE